MAKIKVHELAKELGINSKDIIEILTNTEYAVKAPQSNLEEEAQNIVRKKFRKTSEKIAEILKAESENEIPKTETETEEAKPKKKNVDLGIRKLGSELLIRHLSYSEPQFHHLRNGNPDMHLAGLL